MERTLQPRLQLISKPAHGISQMGYNIDSISYVTLEFKWKSPIDL